MNQYYVMKKPLFYFLTYDKNCFYSCLSAPIQYNSKEKYLEEWSGAHFLKAKINIIRIYLEDKNAYFLLSHNKIRNM